jgi:hypothetical protein
MDDRRIAPDAPDRAPAYFKAPDAAKVPRDAWGEYEPIVYEVRTFVDIARRLKDLPRDADRADANAVIESFALHFRNLADFLWKQPSGTDVGARHFAPGWAPDTPRPGDLIQRVGEEIAHLTTFRRSGDHPDKRWKVADCIRTLRRPLADFVRDAEAAGPLPVDLAAAVASLGALADDDQSMRYFETAVNATTHVGRLQGGVR